MACAGSARYFNNSPSSSLFGQKCCLSSWPGKKFSQAIFLVSLFAVGMALGAKWLGLPNTNWGLDASWAVILMIGIFNGFACYCHWRAIAINLFITSVTTWVDDMIPLILGYLFLQEIKYFNYWLLLGLGGVFIAVLILTFSENSLREISKVSIQSIIGWVLAYSFIWGGAVFAMRYFALAGMSVWAFTSAWYVGSFVGAILTFLFSSQEEQGASSEFWNWKSMASVAPLALNIWICLSLGYWARSLAPLTIVHPIFQVSEMVFPALVGLLVFKEHKHFNLLGWLSMALGLVGGLIIAFSF